MGKRKNMPIDKPQRAEFIKTQKNSYLDSFDTGEPKQRTKKEQKKANKKRKTAKSSRRKNR